jgi:hypothetical protein
LNEQLPKFTFISELFTHNNIPFETWNYESNAPIEIVEMSLGSNCNFQDVYLLAYLLQDFGLESIYPSRDQDSIIRIGGYLHLVTNIGRYVMAKPLNIVNFLSIDPKLDTQIAVDSFLDNNFSNEELYDDEGYNDYDDRYYEDETDWALFNDDLDIDQQKIEFWNQF